MKINHNENNSIHKAGEYTFRTEVHYIRLFKFRKQVEVSVKLITMKASTASWKRSEIVNYSEIDYIIAKLIGRYFEEIVNCRVTLT